MTSKSNDQGRAYEYAWIQTLRNELKKNFDVQIIDNSSLEANKRAWEKLVENPDEYLQSVKSLNAEEESSMRYLHEILTTSASSAIDMLFELEPLLSEYPKSKITLEFQKDQEGVKGDVRDIVIKRDDICWEIGLSIKHNHEAVSHNRLSRKIDFGKNWYDVPCSNEYWKVVNPIFERLEREKNNSKNWNELQDKSATVYVPLLSAFKDEIFRAYNNNEALPRRIIEFLIGIKDYYKIISQDKERLTIIRTFNMNGTLNTPSKFKVSTITVPILELPTKLIYLDFKENSNNTLEMILNNGWQLSFRIHNASTIVEPSLKFDIQFIGTPVSIMNIECKWKKHPN